MKQKFNINARTITAPLAAFCMAAILFAYSRTSILAAKRNAQKHREADGGQINWHNESLRRHGKLESPIEEGTVSQLTATFREQWKSEKLGSSQRGNPGEVEKAKRDETEAERKLRERTGVGR
ncbi:hypothetical protein K3495_g209 [Podosphaera aphanis]|nr:hypothetical protein K3495_g209 [Podosphaera aphanis]